MLALLNNKDLNTDTVSARFKTRIGQTMEHDKYLMELIDKGVYKIDFCPHCKSKNTYHKRIMNINGKKGIHFDNVWKTERIQKGNGTIYIKKDYCYNCQKEFMIEFYVWHVIKELSFLRILKNKIINWLK